MIEEIKNKIKKWKINIKIKNADIIIWDYDGTLYQNKELGQKLKSEYIRYLKRNGVFFSEREFDIASNKYGSWINLVSSYVKRSKNEIMNEIENLCKKHIYLQKNEKLVKKINQLKNKEHYILSNSRVKDIEKGLKRIGFTNINLTFKKIIGRDNSKFLKPNLEAFYNLQKLSKSPKKKHLMIGDSINDDLIPAKKVGFKAMHIEDVNFLWKIY